MLKGIPIVDGNQFQPASIIPGANNRNCTLLKWEFHQKGAIGHGVVFETRSCIRKLENCIRKRGVVFRNSELYPETGKLYSETGSCFRKLESCIRKLGVVFRNFKVVRVLGHGKLYSETRRCIWKLEAA